jgi:formamidopyrimidine-DNA glycosylase
MPEGDTIYRTARALEKALGGRVVTRFETGFAKLASVNDDASLVERVVERVEARGKWCLIYFSGDLILLSHMLMSGSWHIYRTGERWKMPRSKMRVVIRVGGVAGPQGLKPLASLEGSNGGTEVPPLQSQRLQIESQVPSLQSEGVLASCEPMSQKRDMGHPAELRSENEHPNPTHAMKPHECGTQQVGVDVGFEAVLFNAQVAEFHTARSLERNTLVPKLGPDLLGEGFSVERGVAAMQSYAVAHPEAEVGVMLMNQRVLAGLGNVYKSEVAFAAGVNPFRRMSTVTAREMEKMVQVAERYMQANVKDGAGPRGEVGEGIVTYSGPRRTTGAMSHGDRVWVYGRQGQECRRCGTAIMMRKQGEQARSTYWCPVCQPWVAAEGQSMEAPVGRMTVVRRGKVGC